MELSADWVVGFVDGEGCFHVSLNRHREMTVGFQVLPEFVVVQHERDRQILMALSGSFKPASSVVITVIAGVFEFASLTRSKGVRVFASHPLKSKNVDFEKFRRVVFDAKSVAISAVKVCWKLLISLWR